MGKQFDRKYRLIVGFNSVKIEENDIEFEVIRTLSKEPNVAQISVYGLKESTIKSIIDQDNPPVSLFAGYKESLSLIFLGDARDCYAEYEGVESILHINSGDSEVNLRTKRIGKTFRVGTPVITVISELLKTLQVKPGEALAKFGVAKLYEAAPQYVNGVTLSGKASTELDRVCRSCGYQYSIQNGILQALQPKEPLLEDPVILVKDNIVGNAIIGSDKTARFKVLFDGNIKPGKLISLNGRMLRADYCRYFGQSAPSNDWYVEVEGRFQ